MGVSRVLRKAEVGMKLMEEGGKNKKGNVNRGNEEIRHKGKCTHGKENCDPKKVCKGFHGASLSSLSSVENISPRTNNEGNSEKIEKKLVKSVSGSMIGSSDGVEEIQGLRRSSRISNKFARKNDEGRYNRMNHALIGFSDKEISPAMTPKTEGKEKKRTVNRGPQGNGDNLKKNNGDESCGTQGWTKDEELALQRAYFAAKPSPHFWKKVSKLVPGKSAQECIDKINSDLVTPPQPQPQPQSRTKRTNSSPLGHFSLSGSILLEPTEMNIKWPKGKKLKKLLAQKTVRHLVQKRSMVDQGYEADLFSVLEPITTIPIQDVSKTKVLSTAESKLNKNGLIQESHERLSSDQKKPLSRFRNLCQTAIVSPTVLKQVKNKALHERYIDQLHSRLS